MLTRVRRGWGKVVKKNMSIRTKEDNKYGYSQWLKERVYKVGLPFPEKSEHVDEETIEEPVQIEELLALQETLEEVENEKRKLQERLQEIEKENERL